MKTITLFSLGDPGSYNESVDYVNRLHYELSYNLHLMSEEAMEVHQPEPSDFVLDETDISAFLTSFESWLEAAFAAYEAEEPIPDMPEFPSISEWTLPGWLPILIRAAIQLLILYLEKRFGGILPPGSGFPNEFMNAFMKAFLTSEDLEEANPLISLFAAQPIMVRLNYGNRIEEVSLNPE
jgi:hypothetical protein